MRELVSGGGMFLIRRVYLTGFSQENKSHSRYFNKEHLFIKSDGKAGESHKKL